MAISTHKQTQITIPSGTHQSQIYHILYHEPYPWRCLALFDNFLHLVEVLVHTGLFKDTEKRVMKNTSVQYQRLTSWALVNHSLLLWKNI